MCWMKVISHLFSYFSSTSVVLVLCGWNLLPWGRFLVIILMIQFLTLISWIVFDTSRRYGICRWRHFFIHIVPVLKFEFKEYWQISYRQWKNLSPVITACWSIQNYRPLKVFILMCLLKVLRIIKYWIPE